MAKPFQPDRIWYVYTFLAFIAFKTTNCPHSSHAPNHTQKHGRNSFVAATSIERAKSYHSNKNTHNLATSIQYCHSVKPERENHVIKALEMQVSARDRGSRSSGKSELDTNEKCFPGIFYCSFHVPWYVKNNLQSEGRQRMRGMARTWIWTRCEEKRVAHRRILRVFCTRHPHFGGSKIAMACNRSTSITQRIHLRFASFLCHCPFFLMRCKDQLVYQSR